MINVLLLKSKVFLFNEIIILNVLRTFKNR